MFEKPFLEKYKGKATRHECPQCGERNTFARFINPETQGYYADHVGRCNRESKCKYIYTPKQFFIDNPAGENRPFYRGTRHEPVKPIERHYIPLDVLKSSLKAYDKNNFVLYLTSLFGNEKTNELINQYLIATSGKWNGANIFYYINKSLNICYGKVMLYDPITGKREKGKLSHIASILSQKLPEPLPGWLTKYQDQERKINCLFGEHLLKGNTKPIAICESEKTAIIASVYLPEFTWLAAGAKGNLTLDKLKVLKGLNVTLYPDLGAYPEWKIKGDAMGFKTSDILERIATPEQRSDGLDIADWLIQEKPRRYETHTFFGVTSQIEMSECEFGNYPVSWD